MHSSFPTIGFFDFLTLVKPERLNVIGSPTIFTENNVME